MPHPAENPHTHDLVRGRAMVGDFELTICTDGTYLRTVERCLRMVQKPLWERRVQRTRKSNPARREHGDRPHRPAQVAIETGLGNKLSPKMRDILQSGELLPKSLAAAGVRPNEVDIVINSHLHFDHCGWNTMKNDAGKIVPTFPNARYFAHRGEVEHGHQQLERDRISYISDNYDPLITSGLMTLIEPQQSGSMIKIVPGITANYFPAIQRS